MSNIYASNPIQHFNYLISISALQLVRLNSFDVRMQLEDYRNQTLNMAAPMGIIVQKLCFFLNLTIDYYATRTNISYGEVHALILSLVKKIF